MSRKIQKQAFGPNADKRLHLLLVIGAALFFGVLFVWYVWFRSPRYTAYGVRVTQPIPFSHRHHVRDLAIDCRYCHQSAADGPSAGMPSSEVCWSCHSQVFTESPLLEPLRRSVAEGTPIPWKRVTDLNDVVYFDHSAHIVNGIRCQKCHGDVADMALTFQAHPLTMRWCLECHREPAQDDAPAARVASTDSVPPDPFPFRGQSAPNGSEASSHALILNLTDCTVCHR